MTKYYKLNNNNKLLYLIHKYYPNHPYLLISSVNNSYYNLDDNISNQEAEKLGTFTKFNGLIDHSDYFTDSCGLLITKDKKQVIQENDAFDDICLNLFDILPQLEKLGVKETDYCECIYETVFFDINKKFPLFTDEEWNNFTKEALENKALILTDDV